MSDYNPDCWVVFEIDVPGHPKHQKVLAGWYGGYLGSDSWQINSGITKIEEEPKVFLFHGASGSVYRCPKHAQKMSSLMNGVWHTVQNTVKDAGGTARIVESPAEFKGLDT